MTREEKDLLLKDLCGRLPYGVALEQTYKVTVIATNTEEVLTRIIHLYSINSLDDMTVSGIHNDGDMEICFFEEIKPYLFPMSSMTEEQYESLRESGILSNCSHSYEYINPYVHGVSFVFKEFKTYSLELIEWLNKNHFDYRGLIEKGLAINATGLNIY